MQNQPVTEELINEMTEKIVREVNPRKVVLFGSYAKGTPRPDSDLDFLVIEDGPFNVHRSRRAEMARLCMLFPDVRVPIDFLVYSSEEVANLATSKNHIIHHAMNDGRVLYECIKVKLHAGIDGIVLNTTNTLQLLLFKRAVGTIPAQPQPFALPTADLRPFRCAAA